MACMEWICSNTQCDDADFNNNSGSQLCSKCGSEMNGFFDERPDDEDLAPINPRDYVPNDINDDD